MFYAVYYNLSGYVIPWVGNLTEEKSLCIQRDLLYNDVGSCKVKLLRREGVWGSESIDPHFLDLGTRWRWAVSFTPWSLYPRGRAPGTHWIGGWVDPRAELDDVEKKKFLTLPGLQPVTSRYTDWAIPAVRFLLYVKNRIQYLIYW
jgi:hypothetical protein